MKIALDTSALDPDFKAHAVRGTGRYVKELSSYFAAHSSETNISVEPQSFVSDLRKSVAYRFAGKSPIGRSTLQQQIVAPLSLSHSSYDFLHFPAHIDAPAWSTVPTIVTVLDLIPLVLKDLYAPPKNDWRFRLARKLEVASIKRAKLILAISNNTARDVSSLLSIPSERIFVTPLGISQSFFEELDEVASDRILTKLALTPQTCVVTYVGGIDQRKNTKGLLKAFGSFRRALGANVDARLVLVGSIREDREYTALKQRIQAENLEDSVLEAGFLSDSDLRALYRSSTALLFPSLYEGFGLTPLEAMASGCPVVSSDRSCMPEVLGDAALFFDPEEPDQAVAHLLELFRNPQLRATQKERGRERAAHFTWARTAELTLKAYSSLVPLQEEQVAS